MSLNLQKHDIEKAIKDSKGLVSIVAKRLNCSWHSADKYIKEFELTGLMKDEKESLKDFAESKLIENINANDTTSILFFLKTQAKDRGYQEKTNIDVKANIVQKNVMVFGGKEIEI